MAEVALIGNVDDIGAGVARASEATDQEADRTSVCAGVGDPNATVLLCAKMFVSSETVVAAESFSQ